MMVKEMTRSECVALISASRLGRLACSRNDRPYVIPIYYALDGNCLYSFSMQDRKSTGCAKIPTSASRSMSSRAVPPGEASSFTGNIKSFRTPINGTTSGFMPGQFLNGT